MKTDGKENLPLMLRIREMAILTGVDALAFEINGYSFMWRQRHVSVRTSSVVITLAVIAGFPLLALGDDVPPSVVALLPAGAKLDGGSWGIFETEFGKTFAGGLQASSFPGQSPSCVYAGTPELNIELNGDTAWENDAMRQMADSMQDETIEAAPEAMATYVSGYVKGAPDVVSVGVIRDEQLPNGHVVYVEYQENCASHPNGAKTRFEGYARRGATQLQFNFVVALDRDGAMAIAGEILENFEKLDIAALTQ